MSNAALGALIAFLLFVVVPITVGFILLVRGFKVRRRNQQLAQAHWPVPGGPMHGTPMQGYPMPGGPMHGTPTNSFPDEQNLYGEGQPSGHQPSGDQPGGHPPSGYKPKPTGFPPPGHQPYFPPPVNTRKGTASIVIGSILLGLGGLMLLGAMTNAVT